MGDMRLSGAKVLLPDGLREGVSVHVAGGQITAIEAGRDGHDLGGGLLLPGFIDVQVNGGGGLLFNDAPTVDTAARIAAAHRPFGTTGMMITLISDNLHKMAQAAESVREALANKVPGICGLHLEGPFLNAEKRGIHDGKKLSELTDEAMALLLGAADIPLMVTLAPEQAQPDQMRTLHGAGIRVCAGHTNATYDQMKAGFEGGVTGVTHLFNAMSPLTSRAPGAVAAALESNAWCGLIVDGLHVHPAMLRLAMRAKADGRFMLVTDAMPPIGTDMDHFMLDGRRISVSGHGCLSQDGTLAGANLTMVDALRNAMSMLDLSLEEAAALATIQPAAFLGQTTHRGSIAPGCRADLVHLSDDLEVLGSWIGGAWLSAS